ncbi:MAG: 2-hydroxyacid dehydrogenase [Leptolyngbyaceae cyanobacterium CRU_2_3]|nr:2-hydroxyacid dehydrogenase [Leptolyngbyaceae cyanobacterium CRU_2_3]
MRVAVFSTKPYDCRHMDAANAQHGHELVYLKPLLGQDTATLAAGFSAICLFVNDVADARTLETLAANGTKLIALRCAGFNNVDLQKAAELGISIVRVPAYSPYAVAEFAVGLLLTLNRKIHKAYNRVREGNFTLDGLAGFDLHGRTVGVIGTGKIGLIFAEIMRGFGCRILGYDMYPQTKFEDLGGQYVQLPELFKTADVISLHCPLTPETRHLISEEAIAQIKPGVILINTSRGALVDTEAVIEGLKSRQIGALGMDVYEQEANLFFEDLSCEIIQDDVFERLLMFPNVIVTGHQAFFTEDALINIAETTLLNITNAEKILNGEVPVEV